MKNYLIKFQTHSPTTRITIAVLLMLCFFLFGSHSSNSQVYINNFTELERFADEVNSGRTYSGQYVYLTNDIGSPANPFTKMIGNDRDFFHGVFGGGGHTIYVKIEDTTNQYVGLFSQHYLGISNLTIAGSITGRHTVGSIAGLSIGGGIFSCNNRATITGGDTVGGIVGIL